tara:strand:- start:728 stop:1195 length:468 start_codon:yes stop_codon:yes gene_type:complete
MDILNLLTTSATGGALGIIGSIGSGWIKLKQKKADNEHSVAMANIAIKQGELKADSADFTASQEAAQAENESLGDLSEVAQSISQRWFLLLLASYKGSVRPTLAYTAHILAGIAFYYAEPDTRSVMITQVFQMASLYGGWYFGQRDINKRIYSTK